MVTLRDAINRMCREIELANETTQHRALSEVENLRLTDARLVMSEIDRLVVENECLREGVKGWLEEYRLASNEGTMLRAQIRTLSKPDYYRFEDGYECDSVEKAVGLAYASEDIIKLDPLHALPPVFVLLNKNGKPREFATMEEAVAAKAKADNAVQ